MLSLLGAVLGILTGALPELLQYFKNKQDLKKQKQDQEHEIAVLKLQMEAQKQGHVERLEEIGAEADIRESEALYRYAEVKPIPITGNKVVDIITGIFNSIIFLLNGIVRPLVTFAFVGFYGLIKYGQYMAMLSLYGGDAKEKLVSLMRVWTETDHAVFSTIIGHWFGQRMMRWSIEKFAKK